ncbi:SDR family oxidoreductase [Pedobacter frigiditerrae]|uniref:dTDP-4-dehydrorhamnose reductase n=1 Tax=Pedobacter frigiditerrae TaxID=2530452 RepID=A0A4R0MYB9_9SPHI|nr:SDR family oxidoreductase [Pedobacter frigiditerrae]TCC92270.1 SDR family oxidoreductase [Pedobacter frigiditerrae]
MKTILVTGSNGLLGQKITEKIRIEKCVNLIATSKGADRFPFNDGYVYAEMDILNPIQVRTVIEQYKPDGIIHTAAMTNVDTCHIEREAAYQLNVIATQTLVSLCEEFNIHFIHLSTDFVFDGADGPYDEAAKPNPVSYYGETKLQAEELVITSNAKCAILRTILVYGIVSDMSRSNIVLWAKSALEKGNPLNIVNNQYRMPTFAEDLADACLLAVETEAQGIFHISGKDMMSVVELVYRVADFYKLDKSLINEVSAATLNQAAKRPLKTGFILDKAMTELNYHPHSFEEGIEIMDRQMKSLVGGQ